MNIVLLIAALSLQFTAIAQAWNSRAARTENQIRHLNTAITLYQSERGHFPPGKDLLDELVAAQLWSDARESALDDWKRPFQYRFPGKHGPFDLYSFGADGIDDDGRSDDISSWAGVNEGYYWKKQWPGGRKMMRWGKIIGLASLCLGIFFPMRIVVAFAWFVIAFGYFTGSQMLLHPGIVPDYNAPLLNQRAQAGIALLFLIVVFTMTFRKYIQRRSSSASRCISA